MINRCSMCLYPDTKPDLVFTDGVCSACRSFANRPMIDWQSRSGQLLELLERADGKVLVPSSGGKDSTYIAIRLKELGADVTAVTATTCHLTPTGRHNIDNLAKHVRTIEVTPNMTVRAKLNRLALHLVGDISWPEHASIFSVPFRVAAQTGHTLIMYGENPQAEYGGPVGSEKAKEMTRRWVSEFGGFLGLRADDFVGMEGITERDMADYKLPSADELDGIESHFLGAYEQWDSHRNAQVSIKHGMKTLKYPPYQSAYWTYENLDNAQTGLHDYFGWLKYGYARMTAQLSVDIRHGLISREDALEKLKDEGAFPWESAGVSLTDVLKRINMTEQELSECVEKYKNKSIHVS